jgi:transposase-like protein
MTKQFESTNKVAEPVARRRRGKWTVPQRRRIIAQSRVAGAKVREVAERHGVHPNVLSAWRGQEAPGATKPMRFAAVKILSTVEGSIEIDLVARLVRIRGVIDGTMLREVLAAAR